MAKSTKTKSKTQVTDSNEKPRDNNSLWRYHLRVGWFLLALFAGLGLLLETLHGFKWQVYVGVDNVTRREMWTLAHAHGTLLAVVHLCFAATAWLLQASARRPQILASRCVSCASLCMPLGFFLGGSQFHQGDPGLGILLVPIGGLALVAGAILVGISAKK